MPLGFRCSVGVGTGGNLFSKHVWTGKGVWCSIKGDNDIDPSTDTVPGGSWSNIVTTSSTGSERNNVAGELQLVPICGMLTWTFDLEQLSELERFRCVLSNSPHKRPIVMLAIRMERDTIDRVGAHIARRTIRGSTLLDAELSDRKSTRLNSSH